VKILLLNDNPVVNKLVTLSAQKTSDEVDITSTIEGIESQNYDLLIVDDSVYSDELLSELQEKVKYKKSLFICAKDAEDVESFSSILKKPFLPTDLVELFMMFEKEVASEADEEMPVEETQEEEIQSSDLEELSDELSLDDEENLGESVLDDEEAQKVKDLLDENEEELSFDEEVENDIESLELDEEEGLAEIAVEPEEELEFEEELELEDDDLLADYDMALDLEDEADVDISEEDSFDLEDEVETLEDEELEELDTATVEELEDEIDDVMTEELREKEGDLAVDMALDLEDEADVDISNDVVDEFNLEEDIEDEPEDINLESEIQSAVENLSQEDLESELDEDTLLQIATNEIDPLADLTSKDLKVALGEEVEDVDTPAVAALEDIIAEPETQEVKETSNNGVEALKKLLEALSDKDVAASMKGMKISINITLGDN